MKIPEYLFSDKGERIRVYQKKDIKDIKVGEAVYARCCNFKIPDEEDTFMYKTMHGYPHNFSPSSPAVFDSYIETKRFKKYKLYEGVVGDSFWVWMRTE
jgi:hypothetical protein